MFKILCSLLITCSFLFFWSPVEAQTVYTGKWQTGVEVPFYYTSYITTGDHGLIIEGKQTGIEKGRPVNYALVNDRFWTDRLISYEKVYGDTNFKIKLKAPKGSKCKIRIFVYGGYSPKGTIKVGRY